MGMRLKVKSTRCGTLGCKYSDGMISIEVNAVVWISIHGMPQQSLINLSEISGQSTQYDFSNHSLSSAHRAA